MASKAQNDQQPKVKTPKMTAGAGSGPGRLEKTKAAKGSK